MLRALELFGFKSFADRTVFEFSAGITGVVGPNGSGKSNVVDSIKWILGDQSAKSLRGKEMTDVIFNGSTGRTGAQFAEATLTFDNRSRFLPLDLDEVSVGRRLWQSGDSEYLINRNAARLKDVRELFVGTGAGAAAYCIIEQGRVDQILQSNAANRRLIFEEAAGISRFKTRRGEALRRLERVEQNLLRLTDIVDEVESQVSNVRTQAQRASRFRELSAELEQLWVGLAADDFRRDTAQRTLLTEQIQQSADVLAVKREEQQTAERELANADAALTEVDDQLREVERSRAEIRSRIASLETTVRHQAARESELSTDMQRLLRQQTLMNSRVNEAEAEQAHLHEVLTHERTAFEEKKSTLLRGDDLLATMQRQVTESRAAMEKLRQQILLQLRANSDTASAAGALRSEAMTYQQRSAEQQQQQQDLRQQLYEKQQSVDHHQQHLQQVQAELQEAENAADSLFGSREQLLSEQQLSQQSLAELREQRSGLLARRTVLEDLEDRQEGFGIGVREILRRAEEAESPPWNLICGSIADLLDVDMDNAALLEVALSGRAQLLVVRRLQPFVDYLNSGRCQIAGRVGFISLEDADSISQPPDAAAASAAALDSTTGRQGTLASQAAFPESLLSDSFDEALSSITLGFSGNVQVTWVDPRTSSSIVRAVFSQSGQQPPLLFGLPGVVGRADGLARSPAHLPFLASDLLADTWIVETLADALRLHAETSGSCRFVTLQGELIETDGTLFAGTVRSESAVLSRKSELRRLRSELHRLEHEIAQRELRLRDLSGSLQSADDDLNLARRLVRDTATLTRTAESRLHDQQRICGEIQDRIESCVQQQLRMQSSLDELKIRMDQTDVMQQAGEQMLEQQQQQLNELEQQQTLRRRELEELERQRTSASMDLTRSEERLLGLQEAIERVREDLQQRRLQQQEADRRHLAAAERRRELLLARLNTSSETSELYLFDERLAADIRRRSENRNRLRQHRNDATRGETRTREHCRQLESHSHELQLQLRGMDHQLQTTRDRIRDEFQLELEDAVVAGRSAVAVWLARHAERATDGDLPGAETEAVQDSPLPNEQYQESSAATGRQFSPDDRCAEFSSACQEILNDAQRFDELRTEIERRMERLRRQLKKIGHVSTESLDNLNELEGRFNRLHTQLKDLEAARDTLREMVRRINVESRRMFVESFECIRGHFRELFRRLFGGGEADLVLEDPEDVLECAIDVVARPPGKELRSITLLSGGEKTMTAVALLLSIFRSRPSPFCILDEVDAALDDANIGRFVNVLRDFQQSTQFIMITHRKPTMAVTDVLYGVTMEESGVSRRLSLRFEDVDERGNFNPQTGSTTRAA